MVWRWIHADRIFQRWLIRSLSVLLWLVNGFFFVSQGYVIAISTHMKEIGEELQSIKIHERIATVLHAWFRQQSCNNVLAFCFRRGASLPGVQRFCEQIRLCKPASVCRDSTSFSACFHFFCLHISVAMTACVWSIWATGKKWKKTTGPSRKTRETHFDYNGPKMGRFFR